MQQQELQIGNNSKEANNSKHTNNNRDCQERWKHQ
jgi:hypothetical protein